MGTLWLIVSNNNYREDWEVLGVCWILISLQETILMGQLIRSTGTAGKEKIYMGFKMGASLQQINRRA